MSSEELEQSVEGVKFEKDKIKDTLVVKEKEGVDNDHLKTEEEALNRSPEYTEEVVQSSKLVKEKEQKSKVDFEAKKLHLSEEFKDKSPEVEIFLKPSEVIPDNTHAISDDVEEKKSVAKESHEVIPKNKEKVVTEEAKNKSPEIEENRDEGDHVGDEETDEEKEQANTEILGNKEKKVEINNAEIKETQDEISTERELSADIIKVKGQGITDVIEINE